MKRFLALLTLLALTAITLACGGGSTSSTGTGTGAQQAAVFVTGEDAPLPSVVAFNITINSITLNNSSTSVTALSTPTTVDFGRLIGLRSLLGFNPIAPGTYTSATFNFSSPVIDYVNLTTNPPSLGTLNGTLTNSTVTVSFPAAMVVAANGLAGLHMDFDLKDSLAVDSNGNLTGVVNPVITIAAVSASDQLGQVTDFTGSVLSTSASANSFNMQGPWGFQEVIDVNSSTTYNNGYTFSTIPLNGMVSVVGTVQADGSILASAVEVITTDQAFISGRLLQVTPTSGAAQTVTLYIGEELPNLSGNFARGQVVTFDVSGISQYDICFFQNFFTNEFFNASSMVAGQRIFVGGTWDGTTFTPDMISLRLQGVVGTLQSGSVNVVSGNQGSFQLSNQDLLSYVTNGPFTVYTGNITQFYNVNGLSGLSSAGTAPIVAGGLVFKDSISGLPVVWAGGVAVLP
jgi:hypothetical protein